MSDLSEIPQPLPNVPLTLEEAAWPLFRITYQQLRARLKRLEAAGLPVVRDGKALLLYPAHVEAWRIPATLTPPDGVEKWEETCGRWMELKHLANYYAQEDYRDFWGPHLTGMKITEIEETLVHRIIMAERKGRYAVNLKERVPANSTANNYVGFVAKILRFGKVNCPKVVEKAL